MHFFYSSIIYLTIEERTLAFYNEEIENIFNTLGSGSQGVSSATIEQRRKDYGENKLEKQKKHGFFRKLLAQFKNIMIIILIISAIISEVSAIIQKDNENLFEGLLILAIVLINAFVGVIQEQKAENALAALEKSTEPYAKVIRDGLTSKVRVHELVVGDVVTLKAGDFVPADIRIFEANNFKCDESSMTGESQSVLKKTDVLKKRNLPIVDQENMCFFGTNVTSGSATGIVVAVGKNTELGKIAKILNTSIKEKTPLEKNIDKIGKVITFGILGIVVVVFLVQILISKNISVMQALLTAVALAVAAIPESLPAVITIIMALGVQKLARQNAIVKKLSAVETLGCCNVICSDKTGTLTKNEMSVNHVYYSGSMFLPKEVKPEDIDELVEICSVCNTASKSNDGRVIADATETAIINYLYDLGLDCLSLKSQYRKVFESEFNSTKKTMSAVYERDGEKALFVKGAIDYVIENCSTAFVGGKIVPMSDELKRRILKANLLVCDEGERVIAFAKKALENNDYEEKNLTFYGFFGIIDPPRNEAKRSIALCKRAGLKPIMITGDHPSTAFAIAQKLGIAKNRKEVLTGAELAKLSEKELAKIIGSYSVFARVTPEHKLLIVKALKKNGNVVAMTGDGMNDAPSIKCANIGACMGMTGADVTKEVSDIIISDDNFSTLVVAVKEGRTIYQNIQKTILFLLSTNIVEVLGIFVTSLILPDAIFLLPSQILFVNLVTDSLPAFALGIEPSEPNIMEIAPRDPRKSILSGKIGTSILYQGFVQSLIVLIMFVCAKCYYGNAVASTMSFLTICLMQIIHAINCKSDRSIFKINIFKNHFFNFSFLILLGLILGVYFIPALATLFGLTTLSAVQWVFVAATSLSIIPLVEIGKIFIK